MAAHKQSFAGEEGLLGRSEGQSKVGQEHFLVVGESKNDNRGSIFGCKQLGGLRIKSGVEMFGGGERPLGESLRTERQGAERLGGEAHLGERLGTERLGPERLPRVAFNEDRVKAKMNVEENGVLSR